MGRADRRRRARLHLRRGRPRPLSHGRPPPTPIRAHLRRIRRLSCQPNSRDGAKEPLQACDAADRESEPPHGRPRLPLPPRLGGGLSSYGAAPAETLSTRRYPQPPSAGDPSAARGPSAGPAPFRLYLGYAFALAAAASFGVVGVI